MVARIRAGDDAALGYVYDRFAPLVFGIATRLVGDANAGDICQEVFCSLWEQPDRFDVERGSLRSFLATIMRRRCIDQLRRSGRREAREQRVSRQAVSAPAKVDDTAVAHLQRERVRVALQRLPVEQRRAIELAYFDGLSYRQVAVVEGIAEGTAKSRMRLALARLAGELADWGRNLEHRTEHDAALSTTLR